MGKGKEVKVKEKMKESSNSEENVKEEQGVEENIIN